MVSAEEPSRIPCFLTGRYQSPPPTLVPLLSRGSYELTILWHAPTHLTSVLLLQLLSHPLTALKKKDTSTCLLWMSLWLHISARRQDGRRGWAIHPSRAEPHLHSLDAPTRQLDKRLQCFTRWLCSRSSRPRCSPMRKPVWIQPLSGKRNRPGSTRHQSHRPSIWRSMSSLIVLKRLLWLTITEMKEAGKVPFLHAPVSSSSLFGPAVEGFAEHFTEAQKSSQLQHFLPKRISSSSASSRSRPAPIQQTAKPPPTVPEPWTPEGRRDRGHSRSARRYPLPEAPRTLAQDRLGQPGRKRRGPSLATAGPPRKQPLLCLSPLSAGCRGKCVYGSSRAHYSAQVSDRTLFW